MRFWLFAATLFGVMSGLWGNEADFSALRLDDITVVAEKRAEDLMDVALSITPLDSREIENAGIRDLNDASWYVPNLFIGGFGPRHTRFPFVRGLAAGQGAPVATVFLDGVPQLTSNTVDLELLDIERIEVLRGPQGPLYGRNTLGGAITLHTRRPPTEFELDSSVTLGSDDEQRYRLRMAGPLDDTTAYSLAGSWMGRDGYTDNLLTGKDLDGRESAAGRAQLLLNPVGPIEIALSLFGERDREGGFALYDLESLRRNPWQVNHDYEGMVERDVVMPSAIVRVYGSDIDFISTSAYEYWETSARTDLDFSANDWMRRTTREKQHAAFQEFRLQSAVDAPIELGSVTSLSWMAGLAFFYGDQDHYSSNELRPGSPFNPAPVPLFVTADYRLQDWGVAPFAQGTLNICNHWDLTLGLRYEYERREADYRLGFPGMPEISGTVDEEYRQLLPRASVSYKWTERLMTYASVSRGYRAGGYNFNTMPMGDRTYDEESSWTYELGMKSRWFDDRLMLNLALFRIDWQDMQVDVPIQGLPAGSYFLDNAADARSQGIEAEAIANLLPWLQWFGGIGFAAAEFTDYTDPNTGADLAGHELPYAPRYTWHTGLQVGANFNEQLSWFSRAELVGFGDIEYDSANTEGQDAVTMVNLRAGLRRGRWSLEAWIRNLGDEDYVPIAIPASTSSGWAGYNGEPRTFGLTLGIRL